MSRRTKKAQLQQPKAGEWIQPKHKKDDCRVLCSRLPKIRPLPEINIAASFKAKKQTQITSFLCKDKENLARDQHVLVTSATHSFSDDDGFFNEPFIDSIQLTRSNPVQVKDCKPDLTVSISNSTPKSHISSPGLSIRLTSLNRDSLSPVLESEQTRDYLSGDFIFTNKCQNVAKITKTDNVDQSFDSNVSQFAPSPAACDSQLSKHVANTCSSLRTQDVRSEEGKNSLRGLELTDNNCSLEFNDNKEFHSFPCSIETLDESNIKIIPFVARKFDPDFTLELQSLDFATTGSQTRLTTQDETEEEEDKRIVSFSKSSTDGVTGGNAHDVIAGNEDDTFFGSMNPNAPGTMSSVFVRSPRKKRLKTAERHRNSSHKDSEMIDFVAAEEALRPFYAYREDSQFTLSTQASLAN